MLASKRTRGWAEHNRFRVFSAYFLLFVLGWFISQEVAKRGTEGVELQKFTNSVGLKMILVPTGRFVMGSSEAEIESLPPALRGAEQQKEVDIARPFYMSDTEVTNLIFQHFESETAYKRNLESYDRFLKKFKDPALTSALRAPDHPVSFVSWSDARAFCKWLSKKEGRDYRLPTEEEWEYVCRAGSKQTFCFGDDPNNLGQYAWFKDNSEGHAHAVGKLLPNAWGVFDMHGNVFEWCDTIVPSQLVRKSPYKGEQCAMIRGGFWLSSAKNCRCSGRVFFAPVTKSLAEVGFRVVCELEAP